MAIRSLYSAATGMLAQQLNVEVISNNIANLTTTGFKRSRAEFADLLYQEFRRVGSPSTNDNTIVPAGVQIGLGVKPVAVYRMHEQGNLLKTDNQLDVAISGRGFFNITLPNGETAYTRNGSFQISPDGEIVTVDGFLLPGLAPIPEDTVQITINQSGEILAARDGVIDPDNLGQIEMTTFINDAGLQAIGDNLLLETPASGDPVNGFAGDVGFGQIVQGFLETSNVNAVTEITNLITAQRTYEMNSQVVQASDELLRTVSNIR